MKKLMVDLIVTENVQLHPNYNLIKLSQKDPFPEILPGQFVQIKIDNTSQTFLRRPISICFVDRKKNELWLLIQVVGDGTLQLSRLNAGDRLNLIYPLGNSFSLIPTGNAPLEKILLVGGGVGIAPLLMLGSYLKEKNYNPEFLLGFRTSSDILLLDEFEKIGNVFITTEDGSIGEKGYVTHHSILENEKYNMIYSCGPQPMMLALASYAHRNNIPCEVSLENLMACGIGACLCCVEDTVDGHVCVCVEGPVINIKKLKWQI